MNDRIIISNLDNDLLLPITSSDSVMIGRDILQDRLDGIENRLSGTNIDYDESSKILSIDILDPNFVDLGLPSGLLWAKCNLGAKKPELGGKYFLWGDIVGYYPGKGAEEHSYWETAPFNNGDTNRNDSYFTSIKSTVCPGGILAPQYDAATIQLGEKCRIPTKTNFEELIANTTSTWESVNGVYGRRFTSKKDISKSIFIPAADGFQGGKWNDVPYTNNSYGQMWTSTLSPVDWNAWRCYTNKSNSGFDYLGGGRLSENSIRAVKQP